MVSSHPWHEERATISESSSSVIFSSTQSHSPRCTSSETRRPRDTRAARIIGGRPRGSRVGQVRRAPRLARSRHACTRSSTSGQRYTSVKATPWTGRLSPCDRRASRRRVSPSPPPPRPSTRSARARTAALRGEPKPLGASQGSARAVRAHELSVVAAWSPRLGGVQRVARVVRPSRIFRTPVAERNAQQPCPEPGRDRVHARAAVEPDRRLVHDPTFLRAGRRPPDPARRSRTQPRWPRPMQATAAFGLRR